MYRKVLLAYDGSIEGRRALREGESTRRGVHRVALRYGRVCGWRAMHAVSQGHLDWSP
jgi:hypothetical protein